MASVKDLLVNGSSRFIGKIYASDQFISQVANGTAPFVISSSTLVTNLNSDMTDGLHVHTGRNNEVNKIVRTDANGYIQTGYINTNVGTENLAISRIFYEYNNDGYIRKMAPSSFFSVLENSGNVISITVAGQNRKLTVGYASNADNADKIDGIDSADIIYGTAGKHGTVARPAAIDNISKSGFYYTNGECGTSHPFTTSDAKYGFLLSMMYDDSVDYQLQLFCPYTGDELQYRRKTAGNWNDPVMIMTSGNYSSYVKNASLTLQTAGTTQTTFYANDSTNRTFNVTCANIGAAPDNHNHDDKYVPYFIGASKATVDSTNNRPRFFETSSNGEFVSGYGQHWYTINMGNYNGNSNHPAQITMPFQSDKATDMFIRVCSGTSWRAWQRVFHDGNYTSYVYSKQQADDRFVNVIGDTMTGALTFNYKSDTGLIKNTYGSTVYNLIRNHNNGNISISASSSGLYIGYENTTGLYFYISNSERMRIDSSGNVGIGITSPEAKLHVGGNQLISGSLTIKGIADTGQISQGGFNKGYSNILLQGDNTYGISGITFLSKKSNDTNIGATSDVAFIQYHPYGVTASAYNTTPAEASSGEKSRLVIGVGNDISNYTYGSHEEPDGTKWIHIAHHNNPAEKLFNQNDNFSQGVFLDDDRWFNVHAVVSQLTTFEFLVIQKSTTSSSIVKYRWIQTKSPLTATYSDVSPSAVTRITTSGYTDGGYGGLYILNSNSYMVIANNSNGNWYGAFGSWSHYGAGIPGYPNTDIGSGYMDLYVRADSGSGSNSGDELWLQTAGHRDLLHYVVDKGYQILDAYNYIDVTVTKTGLGATGTWDINVSGTSSNITGTVVISHGGTGATTAAGARANLGTFALISDSYTTLMLADGTSNGWIKIGTSNSDYGLLPSTSGSAGSGHNYIGTSSWYWKYAYIDQIYGYLNGNISGNAAYATSAGDSATLGGHNAAYFAIAGHTHDDRYYTESESDSRFVNVTGDSMSGALSIQTQAKTKSSPTAQQLVINGPDYNSSDSTNLQYFPGIGFHLPGRTWANLIWNGYFTGVNASFDGYVGFYGSGFTKNGSSDSYFLLGGGGHTAISNYSLSSHNHDDRYYTETESDARFHPLNGKITRNSSNYNWNAIQQYNSSNTNPSYYNAECAIINLTSSGYWQPWIRCVTDNKNSWGLGQCGENVHFIFFDKSNTGNPQGTYSWNFLSNGQLSISVGTGTAPLGISSTTCVGNLNADLLDGNHASAFATSGHTHSEYASSNHNHDERYLKLSGGTMTGPLKWTDNNALPERSSIDYILTIDAFASGGKTYWASIATLKSSLGLGSNAYTSTAYLPLTGGTMTGCITTKTGSSHNGIKLGDTYLTSIDGEVIFQNNTSIRFGGDSWDWDNWAELGYKHSDKIIYLGLAGSPYTANNTQSGGKIYTPGTNNIYIGNGTYRVWHTGDLTLAPDVSSVGYTPYSGDYKKQAVTNHWLAYWNGAYSSGGSSNLQYCDRGRFGTIVTYAPGNFVQFATVSASTVNGTNNAAYMYNVEGENIVSGFGSYWYVLNFGGYSGSYYRTQIAMPYHSGQETEMFIRIARGSSWLSWRNVVSTLTTTATSVASLDCKQYTTIHVTRSSAQTMSFSTTPSDGKECHIIIYNSGSSTITITLPSSYRRNVSSITIASGAFGEVNVLNAAGTIYVRAV